MDLAASEWDFSGLNLDPNPNAGQLILASGPPRATVEDAQPSSESELSGGGGGVPLNPLDASIEVPDEYITVAGREWIENVFGNGGILAGWMEDISRRTSRVPATFPQDWNELRNSVLTIDASIQQRLARMEIISQQIALIQGLLNELNVRQEEYGTAVQVIDRNLNTITEHGRALTAEQANTFNIVNQIYVDLQAQRITMQGLSDHVGHLAPRHTSIPQPAVNTADVDVGGQPRVVERSSGNELVGILAAVVLVLVIAVIKWFETKQVD